jgi:hypothetical protein
MAACRRKLIVMLALGCGLNGAFASPALARNASTIERGINIKGISQGLSDAQVDASMSVARRLHANAVRVALPWSQFEPREPGRRAASSVAATNRLMHDAAIDGIKVIALVDDTPCWASTAPQSLLEDCGQGHHSYAEAYPPLQPASLGRYVEWLAKTYGKQLAAIEIWNEPDQQNEDYLAGPEKPQHYAELLKAAYPAIKKADPALPVLAGSLVGSNGAFMDALYEQGIKGYYNGVAVHFYSLTLASMRRFREVQLEHGDHTPLWLDEFGWSSCWPKYAIEQEQGCVTPRVQAQNITSSFSELARAPYVKALLTYGFQDSRGEEFGVLGVTGRRKPSFEALANALASPFGAPPRITIHLRVNGGQIVASGSGPVGDYMKLEAFREGHFRYGATFTLNRFNKYSLSLPKALGTSHLAFKVYQYWLGPSDDAVASI